MKFYSLSCIVINSDGNFIQPDERYTFYYRSNNEISAEFLKEQAQSKINEYSNLARIEFFEFLEISEKEFNSFLVRTRETDTHP